MRQHACDGDETVRALQVAIDQLTSVLTREESPIVRLHYSDTLSRLNLCIVDLRARVND